MRPLCEGLFQLRYGDRRPLAGPGLQRHGISAAAAKDLVDGYASGISRTRQWFADAGWPDPPRGVEGYVPVYVLDPLDVVGVGADASGTIPRQKAGFRDASTILLRSSLDVIDRDRWRERAEVEAAHETAHVFLHGLLSPLAQNADAWKWFDEASATFVERAIFPGHPETLRFARQWIQQPELPISLWGCRETDEGYSSAWFVRHLVNLYGSAVLLDIWGKAPSYRRPWLAIEEALNSRGASLEDVLWTYYAYGDGLLDPAATALWGEKPLTWILTEKGETTEEAPIFPEGCRNYEIALPAGAMAEVSIAATRGILGEIRAEIFPIGTNTGMASRGRLIKDGDSKLKGVVCGGTRLMLVVGRPQPAQPRAFPPLGPTATLVKVAIT